METALKTQASFELDEISVTDRTQFSDLLNSCFSVPGGSQFLEDFPVWDSQWVPNSESLLRFGIYHGMGPARTLACSAAIRLAQLKTPSGDTLPIALLGGVATREEFRGKGFASKAVETAVAWAQDRGAALVMLWGSEQKFYSRLGFEMKGEQKCVPLSALELPIATTTIGCGWTPSLFRTLRHRPYGLKLENSDFAWIQAHKNVTWYWSGDSGNPSAYAAIGRGIDLPNLVHEWGGKPEALLPLLAAVRQRHPESFIMGCTKLFKEHGISSEQSPAETLALMKVLDPVRVAKACLDPLWIWGLDAC